VTFLASVKFSTFSVSIHHFSCDAASGQIQLGIWSICAWRSISYAHVGHL